MVLLIKLSSFYSEPYVDDIISKQDSHSVMLRDEVIMLMSISMSEDSTKTVITVVTSY